MTSSVEHSVEIGAPVSEVFAYVDDYTNTKDWICLLYTSPSPRDS